MKRFNSKGMWKIPGAGKMRKGKAGTEEPMIVKKCYCPECKVPLPIYAPCDCGADMITLFRDKHGNFCNCIGICNRVGCSHAEIKRGSDMFNIYRRKGEIRGTQGYI